MRDVLLYNNTHFLDVYFLASGFLAFLSLSKISQATMASVALAIFYRWLRYLIFVELQYSNITE